MKKVLILGGGFAGVKAAINLSKKKLFDVTLISDRDYLFLYPISIWIPTGKLKQEDAKVSLHDISKKHKFNLFIDSVTKIDTLNNQVEFNLSKIKYDYLIIAMGSDKVNHPGIENTLSICGKPEVAGEIKNRLFDLIEQKEGKIAIGFGGNPKDQSGVRGGPAFELIFNIHNLLCDLQIRDRFEITFFAPMESPGKRMGAGALKMVEKMFVSNFIKSKTGVKISRFNEKGITFEDDSELEADLTLFIPAGTGKKLFADSGLPVNEGGFIKIDDTCLVNETKNVYAIGDSAALEGPEWKAKQGHIAEVMADCATNNLINTELGLTERKGYQKHLNILCIMDTGKDAAIVFRNSTKAIVIPLPIIGHWIKKGWGWYAKKTKVGLFS